MDNADSSSWSGRRRRRALTAPLVIVAAGAVGAACAGTHDHVVMGVRTSTTTTEAQHIVNGVVPQSIPGPIVTGLTCCTPHPVRRVPVGLVPNGDVSRTTP